MKRYTAAQARQRFSDLLDSAEAGQPVVIVRRRVRFTVRAEPARSSAAPRTSIFGRLHPAVEEGLWTWRWGPGGLRFVPLVPRKRGRR